MTQQTTRFITRTKPALIITLISVALVVILQFGFLPQVSYLGFGLFLFPVLLLMVAAVGGILPSTLALIMIGFFSSMVYGPKGWWLVLCLAPMTATFLFCLVKKTPFFETVLFVLLAFIAGLALSFVILQRQSNGNFFGMVTQAAINGLDQLPERDPFLFLLWRSGFLSYSGEAAEQLMNQVRQGSLVLNAQTVEEFYKQISARLNLLLSSLLPGLLTTYAISLSFLGTGMAMKLGLRLKTVPSLNMPPFSVWFLPRTAGRYMLVLSLGYLLALFSSNQVLQTAGQMMYNVFFALYTIQGLAYMNFMMKRRNMKPFLRGFLLSLLYGILSLAAMLLGIMDQITDPRKLRGDPPATSSL